MRSILRASAVLFVVATITACSSANSSNSASGGGGGAGNSGGISMGGSLNVDGGGGTGGLTNVCGGEVLSGENVPLDLFIMLDQSGSMGQENKWPNVTSALNGFFAAPPLSNLSAGLAFFGQPMGPCTTNTDCGVDSALEKWTCDNGLCTDCIQPPFPGFPPVCVPGGLVDSCNAADYAKAEVPIAPLDSTQASQLAASIAKHGPSTGTPTSAALDGAIQFAQTWQAAHADHKTVVVLATDGEPANCDTNIADIAAIAQNGATGTPPINTFVVGVGPSLHALDPVATAGGTGTAIVVDTSQQAFSDALKQISKLAAACEYVLPKDKSVDINKVNVLFTPSGATDPDTLKYVTDPANCDQDGGWYYDNKAQPTKVIVCPASCDKFKTDSGGKVEFQLGCPNKIN